MVRVRFLVRGVLLALAGALFVLQPARAQPEGVLQMDDPLHRFLVRQQTAGHLPGAFLSHQPLSAYEARRYLDSLAARRGALSPLGQQLLARFRGEAADAHAAWLHARLPFLYQDGQHFFAVAGEDYGIHFSPLLYLSAGRARRGGPEVEVPTVTTWQNTRGVRAAGHVDIGGPLLFFETRLEENQRRVVEPVPQDRRTAPRLGQVKVYADGVYDYWVATGVVGLHTEHFEVRLGRDRNRWGPGRTSLVLSDYGPVYDQLQLRTSVWRLQYTNLYTILTDHSAFRGGYGDQPLPNKYGVFHRLAIGLPGRVQLGLFESIILPPDTAGLRPSGFDLAYLNPLIFYRAVEADRGSPDNVLLGADVSWVALPGLKLYTQFILDEFVASEIFRGVWRDKWGWLVGAHTANLLPGLSARLEYARLRPYLYSHESARSAYLHYDDLLGHPAGPNAEEAALFLAYQLTPRWHAALNLAYTRRGRNTDSLNYGADPRRSYTEDLPGGLTGDAMPLGQGVPQETLLLEAWAGYEVLPDLHLEAALRVASVDDARRGLRRYVQPFLMLRWGLPFQSARY